MGLLGLSRFARLFLLLTILLIIPTLYLLYPSHTQAPSPGDEIYEYEAGGIDSPHWRDPVKPDFETEEVRDWGDELVVGCPAGKDCGDGPLKGGMEMEVEDGRGSGLGMVDEGVLGGGVIMPKLENAITKWVGTVA